MTKRLSITLLAFAIWTLITLEGSKLLSDGQSSLLDTVARGFGWPWAAAGGFILTVVLWQGWTDVGLNRKATLRDWRLTWVLWVYILGALAASAYQGLPALPVLAVLLLNTFFVGFSEELMFRGALLQAFRRSMPIWPAVLLTSVAFGAIHSLNVFVTGDLRAALIQSSAAFLSGLIFIALRLRTGSLWPSIIMHGLWDFASFVLSASTIAGGASAPAEQAVTGAAQLLPMLIVLPNAICGLWLMRRIGRTHVSPES